MDYQPVFDIAEICVGKKIKEVVLCPGSRCAPLTLAFTRNKGLTCRTFSDERSAGFIGLGIAQQKKEPVILLCTSGTAAYNFAPAVAEAFFNQVPLIVFTADRPAEWIAQHDGQTIYQGAIYGKHVKKSFELPGDYVHPDSHWAINRIINEAINLARQEPKGPVHINAPFREPLYPEKHTDTFFSDNVRIIGDHTPENTVSPSLQETIISKLKLTDRILIVAGQQEYDPEMSSILNRVSQTYQIPVAGDIISNINDTEFVLHSDLFLGQAPDRLKKMLQPDLLITFGNSLVSKNLKIFLRKFQPKQHWHIQPAGIPADTFKSLTDTFHLNPKTFFAQLVTLAPSDNFLYQKRKHFRELWVSEERRVAKLLNGFSTDSISEIDVVRSVLENLPDNSNLHLANSMSVRYANFLGLPAKAKGVKVFSNRGTSGIDGCSSTAVGHALASPQIHTLITGDVAFFYDRNAYWHNYAIPNLRVVLLNNHGGLIFNMIDGPASQPEAAEYFITRQHLNGKKLCEEFGFEYMVYDQKRTFKELLRSFFETSEKIKVLEVESDVASSRQVFDKLKSDIKNNYED